MSRFNPEDEFDWVPSGPFTSPIAQTVAALEPFDPSDYERPPKRQKTVAEFGKTAVHLVKLAIAERAGPHFVTWCQESTKEVAFDPRVATCARCLRALHEAVSQ